MAEPGVQRDLPEPAADPPGQDEEGVSGSVAVFKLLIADFQRSTYTNPSTGIPIDYYEVEIKNFTQQVYKGLKPARLVGYDGISPGPTFKIEKGRESVVRFINRAADRANSVHLHGSYSE